jgi:5'-3' exonuclease
VSADLIVDGPSLWARSWYAVDEDATLAVKAGASIVLKLLDQDSGRLPKIRVERTLFCWDGKPKTDKKHAVKATGYNEAMGIFRDLMTIIFGTAHAYHPEFEADDAVATVVFNLSGRLPGRLAVVVSADRDLMQLHGGNVYYYDLRVKSLLTSIVIVNKFGVKKPNQIPLAQAIIGDSGDGIPGIRGWGPKRSAKLFESVTKEMNFSEAYQALVVQIPEHLLAEFDYSLDKTLLHTEIDGLPDPAMLAFCDSDVIQEVGVQGIAMDYDRVASQYEDRRIAMKAMIRGSESV